MSKRRPRSSTIALIFVLWATRAALPAAEDPMPQGAAPAAAMVAIVNTENAVKQVSMGDLRRILLGEMTRWPDGRTITIAMRPAGQPEHAAVLRLICGMNDADFARHVLQAAYRGEAQSGIKVLDTSTGVRRFVFNVPGAIGFVRADEVDNSVRFLHITGAIPKASAFGLTLRAQ